MSKDQKERAADPIRVKPAMIAAAKRWIAKEYFHWPKTGPATKELCEGIYRAMASAGVHHGRRKRADRK